MMKNQINYFLGHILLFLLACFFVQSTVAQDNRNSDYKVAAYIWPSTHNDMVAEKVLWPEGTGEWEIIKKGTPRFEGHYQPKVPLWGYQMDDDPTVMEKWIDAATDHGVNVFIFDWYWFGGGPFLENSLNEGFLKAKNNNKMEFYIMWANHDVKKNYWNPYKYKEDTSPLWDGAVDTKNFEKIVDRVIKQYFNQDNYFKINGKPVFSVFSIENLLQGFNGLEGTKKAFEYFRSETKKAGFPGLHTQLIGDGAPTTELINIINELNFDSVTKYNWGGPHPEDYIQWGVDAIKRRNEWDKALSIPFFPNASIGWDDTPRFPEKGKEDVVHYNSSPETFASFLQKTKEYVDIHTDQPKLITIFSWNEWVEGSYLLPDIKYGFEYLNAVKRVMDGNFDKYSKENSQ